MSIRSRRFVRHMATLIETAEDVREVLERYIASSVELATRVERGEQLQDIYPAIEGPARPREVTEILAKFEAARHQVRLAMFELGREQGLRMRGGGRQLGAWRQRASALANKAKAARR